MKGVPVQTLRAVALYAVLTAVFLGAADLLYAYRYFPRLQPTSAGTTGLVNRMAWYEAHRGDYDLIFFGDSRTYCGIHPELVDPLLGTRSLNLGGFSNWFLTQLSMAQKLAPLVPKGTTVVWSIGPEFVPIGSGVQRVYPVGVVNALRYLSWGLPSTGLADNVLYYNPVLHFLSMRGDLRQRFVSFLNEPFRLDWAAKLGRALIGAARAEGVASAAAPESAPATEDEVRALKERWEKDPRVAYVDVVRDEGKPTSLTVFFERGSYYRVELDPAFFRRKQQEMGASFKGSFPQVDPAYWHAFEEILRIFKENGVSVVVNEIEEAPYVYGDPEHREVWRSFMREVVERRVREAGFPYVRVDFDRLTDEDYFDYNHLNSRGAETFTPMIADRLRPHLHEPAPDRAARAPMP